MTDRETPRFSFASVTRGGWLTIANCAAWAVFFSFRGTGPDWLWTAVIYVVGTPLVLPLLWFDRLVDRVGAVPVVLTIGLNSIVWGYGLSWVWSLTVDRPRRRRRARAGQCPACGYDLRGSARGVCPECGAATA